MGYSFMSAARKIDMFGKDTGYWMGWITAFTVAALTAACLAIGMFLQGSLCTGAEGEHCLREWTSALAGWGAIAAGVPSILFLARQLATSERAHEVLAQREIRRRRALFARAGRTARELAELSATYMEILDDYDGSSDEEWRAGFVIDSIDKLSNILDLPVFDAFEDEVVADDTEDVLFARRYASINRQYLSQFLAGKYPLTHEEIDKLNRTACSEMAAYAQRVIRLVEKSGLT
ncbi:hypothetical protein [Rhizobium halophilum]|uniref:hypothetical protein n=1 Tax=Rhizobium halophilum TaxID=2846852 RepID=UPI001EFE4178|nr:hypothetical protein [Rhizobium halophilum]MCF6368319.1 hypothetical protein [Rhizobium halophilum]